MTRLRNGLLILLVGLLPACQLLRPSVNLALEPRELQDAVAKRFPMTAGSYPVSASLRKPQVILRDGDNRVGLNLDAELAVPLLPPFRGRIAVIGVPRYDPEQKTFFLNEPELERLELPGVSTGKLDLLNSAIERLAGPVLAATPLYTIPDRTLKDNAARYLLREVSVHDGKLHLRLSPPDDLVAPSAAPTIIAVSVAALLAGAFGTWLLRKRRVRQ